MKLYYDPAFVFDGPRVFSFPERAKNPKHPRYPIIQEHIAALVESIQAVGVMYPVVVTYRPQPAPEKHTIEVHPGQSRCRALRRIGYTTVPAIIVDHVGVVTGQEITQQEANELLGGEVILSTKGKWTDKQQPPAWKKTIPDKGR